MLFHSTAQGVKNTLRFPKQLWKAKAIILLVKIHMYMMRACMQCHWQRGS